MLRVGLTGGIASGKSVVSEMFGSLGAHVIDADVLAREELAPGTQAFEETVRSFGEGILDTAGRIDRARLADIVFSDPLRRAELEAIVHPGVLRRQEEMTGLIAAREPRAVVVFAAALLVESGAHREMDRVVVVSCSRETQLRRLVEKVGLTPAQAEARLDSQMPDEQRKCYADHVIDNDDGLGFTKRQVEELFRSFSQYI